MNYDRNARLATAFTRAINGHDLDAFLTTLAPEVELRTRRGLLRGRTAAARWFERPLDHLEIEIEPQRLVVGEDWTIGFAVVRMRWRETGEVANEAPGAALWRFGADGIAAWEPLDDPAQALAELAGG